MVERIFDGRVMWHIVDVAWCQLVHQFDSMLCIYINYNACVQVINTWTELFGEVNCNVVVCGLTLYRYAMCHMATESYEWHFGRSDVSLCVCLTRNLYVVGIYLSKSCTVILILRIVRRSRFVGCLLGEKLACAKVASAVRQIYDVPRLPADSGVDSRRCCVGGLFPIGFPFPFLSVRGRSLPHSVKLGRNWFLVYF